MAARFLIGHAESADIPLLRLSLQTETVFYVRNCLEIGIKKANDAWRETPSDDDDEYKIPDEVVAQIKREATEEVARIILHEIASNLGLIALAASEEVPNYTRSRTKSRIEHLKRVFEAIEQLQCASSIRRIEEFDLAELLAEVVSGEVTNRKVDVSLHGSRPMLITSDPSLLRLAVTNGIRNSVEALCDSQLGQPHQIVVTWGETDVDYWAAVLDDGPGVVVPAETAFRVGNSTKDGHGGFGLRIARQAIETLGGSCNLFPGAGRGARFEIRWER